MLRLSNHHCPFEGLHSRQMILVLKSHVALGSW